MSDFLDKRLRRVTVAEVLDEVGPFLVSADGHVHPLGDGLVVLIDGKPHRLERCHEPGYVHGAPRTCPSCHETEMKPGGWVAVPADTEEET